MRGKKVGRENSLIEASNAELSSLEIESLSVKVSPALKSPRGIVFPFSIKA